MIKKIWFWIRYGKVKSEVKSTDGGRISEESFMGRNGRRVGYWAYGSFDPGYPYQGQDVFFDKSGWEANRYSFSASELD